MPFTSFTLLPESALSELRREARESYHGFMLRHGRRVYNGRSSIALAALLPCLNELHHIDLLRSEHDELSAFLTQERGSTHFIFTPAHRAAYIHRLDPDQFSSDRFRDYYNRINAANDPDAGNHMLNGLILLRENLAALRSGSVLILTIF